MTNEGKEKENDEVTKQAGKRKTKARKVVEEERGSQ